MGLFETIGNSLVRSLDNAKEKISEEEEKCANWSDDRLKRAFRSTTSLTKKTAYRNEWVNRGNSDRDLLN